MHSLVEVFGQLNMILGLIVDKHLDYVCEHETNIDDDTLNSLRINHNIHVSDDIDSQFDYPSSDEYWANKDQ